MSQADICLILEGTYPFVRGGVAAWTHEMITRQDHLRFHIVSLLPRDENPDQQYAFPANVVGHTVIRMQQLKTGAAVSARELARMKEALREPLEALTTGVAHLDHYRAIIETLGRHPEGGEAVLNSEEMWGLLTEMYEDAFPESSLLDYFWSWRALVSGVYSLLAAPLPEAKVYHALSTGYAGMMLARAKIETGRPCLLTEHGIYTNERRIEVALADWLTETASRTLTIDRTRLSLRDFWIDSFANYSRIAYEASDSIITLFAGNQTAQIEDGADPARMRIIPNGVDLERFASIQKRSHERPTVALIGRVVPIKDVKTFLRSVASLRDMLPDVRALVLGPTDEDPAYVDECQSMMDHLALRDHVTFAGQVRIDDYLPEIDVLVLSSLSEAQPLVLLEGGACGIPAVATDVGACREIVMGREDESPRLGAGGSVVPLASPQALADAMFKLLTDQTLYRQSASVIRRRVSTYYNKRDQINAYRELYAAFM